MDRQLVGLYLDEPWQIERFCTIAEKEHGMLIDMTEDIDSVLTMVRDKHYDFIILEPTVLLPKIYPHELVKSFRDLLLDQLVREFQGPIILATSMPEHWLETRLIARVVIIPKPYDSNEIFDKIDRLVKVLAPREPLLPIPELFEE